METNGSTRSSVTTMIKQSSIVQDWWYEGMLRKKTLTSMKFFFYMVRLTTVRMVLAICVTFDLHLKQLDMKIGFLHGNFEEEIYMLQLEGFEE